MLRHLRRKVKTVKIAFKLIYSVMLLLLKPTLAVLVGVAPLNSVQEGFWHTFGVVVVVVSIAYGVILVLMYLANVVLAYMNKRDLKKMLNKRRPAR